MKQYKIILTYPRHTSTNRLPFAAMISFRAPPQEDLDFFDEAVSNWYMARTTADPRNSYLGPVIIELVKYYHPTCLVEANITDLDITEIADLDEIMQID